MDPGAVLAVNLGLSSFLRDTVKLLAVLAFLETIRATLLQLIELARNHSYVNTNNELTPPSATQSVKQ